MFLGRVNTFQTRFMMLTASGDPAAVLVTVGYHSESEPFLYAQHSESNSPLTYNVFERWLNVTFTHILSYYDIRNISHAPVLSVLIILLNWLF